MNYPAIPHSFYTGDCFNAYRFFGAHPAMDQGKKGWMFRVYAPNAKLVELICDFDKWEAHPMDEFGGVWSLFIPDLKEGALYKYRMHSKEGWTAEHNDPYAFSSELRPGTASRLASINFTFDDDAWMYSRDKCRNRPMNIYELHAGSWRHKPGCKEEDGSDGWYNYEELAELLIPWLVEHHFTHVELLPLAEHPFDGSWGYQNTGYFSVTSRYGTPAQFAAFVNTCHKAGIGVLMDFVPVHFAPNTDSLAQFDTTCLYEYDSDVGRSEWGTCNFNFDRGDVRSFLNSACAMWMDVYHCDGIRMDAISRAIYWMGDPNRGTNEGALSFLRNLNHGLNARWPNGIYVAEDSTSFNKVTAPTRDGGLGFDYKWDMGWMHDTLDFFSLPFEARPNAYDKITWSMAYYYNEHYLLALSHDEVVHGKKTIIDKLWGTYDEKTRQMRTLYFYMMTHPGKKLNFMGNETAHFREWDEKKELDWFLLQYPFHDSFHKYFAKLSAIYASEPALFEGEYSPNTYEWVSVQSRQEGVYAWLRKGRGPTLLCIMNTQWHDHKAFPLYLREAQKANELINSENEEWGGRWKGLRTLHTTPGGVYGKDHTLFVDIPAMGSCLFRLTPEDALNLAAPSAAPAKKD